MLPTSITIQESWHCSEGGGEAEIPETFTNQNPSNLLSDLLGMIEAATMTTTLHSVCWGNSLQR